MGLRPGDAEGVASSPPAVRTMLEQDLVFSDYLDVRREGGAPFGSAEASRPPQAVVWGEVSRRFGRSTCMDDSSIRAPGDLIFR
ncbi:MAG: hypothetical protein R3E12_19955 [Candidatus Eisenbacteria bacterium]